MIAITFLLSSCGVGKELAKIMAPQDCSTTYVIRSLNGSCGVYVVQSVYGNMGQSTNEQSYCSRSDAEEAMCQMYGRPNGCPAVSPANVCK